MIICLTGFMGVGKSTVSRQLARHLFCDHIDLDKYIESAEGRSVRDIFGNLGEEGFRKKEEYYLDQIISYNTEKVLVLSLGGGTLISKVNQKIIKESTFCIYLRSGIGNLAKRLENCKGIRPVISATNDSDLYRRVAELFEIRKEGYEQSSSLIIDTDGLSVKEILKEIMDSI